MRGVRVRGRGGRRKVRWRQARKFMLTRPTRLFPSLCPTHSPNSSGRLMSASIAAYGWPFAALLGAGRLLEYVQVGGWWRWRGGDEEGCFQPFPERKRIGHKDAGQHMFVREMCGLLLCVCLGVGARAREKKGSYERVPAHALNRLGTRIHGPLYRTWRWCWCRRGGGGRWWRCRSRWQPASCSSRRPCTGG